MSSVSSRFRRQRGFTLFELLAVLGILGLILAIGVAQLNSFWQRSRLESAVTELRTFLDGVSQQTRQDRPGLVIRPVWVRLDTTARTVTAAADPGFADVLAEHRFPGFLRVTADWVASGGANGPWTLQCDPQGRAVDPTNANLVDRPQVVTVTHQNMVAGRLRPHTRYHVQVAPIWNVSVRREVL